MRILAALACSAICCAADAPPVGDSQAVAELIARLVPDAKVQAWGATQLIVTAPDRDSLPAGPMAQRITVDWKDSDLASAGAMISRMSGLNVVVHPGVAARSITLKVEGMALGQVLKWMGELGQVQIGWESGAVYVSAEAPRASDRTVIYDIAALVAVPRDFPGPELAFNAEGRQGMALLPPR